MENRALWSQDCTVRFEAVDRSDRLRLSAAFGLFQEAATSHAESIGVGRDDMARAGRGWVLSRMSVQVDRRPLYLEKITVRSWPRKWEKLFAVRDFDILDGDGKTAVRGRSCWLVIDTEKRRPLRPQAVMEILPLYEKMDALPYIPASLAENANLQKRAQLKAVYGDIDYNGHVNNVSYIRWIENAVDSTDLENAGRFRLDINYNSEVLLGETVDILSAGIQGESPSEGEAALAFEGIKACDGKAAFRAELILA